jgi:hypothetical protein
MKERKRADGLWKIHMHAHSLNNLAPPLVDNVKRQQGVLRRMHCARLLLTTTTITTTTANLGMVEDGAFCAAQ